MSRGVLLLIRYCNPSKMSNWLLLPSWIIISRGLSMSWRHLWGSICFNRRKLMYHLSCWSLLSRRVRYANKMFHWNIQFKHRFKRKQCLYIMSREETLSILRPNNLRPRSLLCSWILLSRGYKFPDTVPMCCRHLLR